jgi:hypothetical protein
MTNTPRREMTMSKHHTITDEDLYSAANDLVALANNRQIDEVAYSAANRRLTALVTRWANERGQDAIPAITERALNGWPLHS